jgi:hypothetical protein
MGVHEDISRKGEEEIYNLIDIWVVSPMMEWDVNLNEKIENGLRKNIDIETAIKEKLKMRQ